MKFFELIARNGRRTTARANAGAEKRFIGIDVADAAQKFLIQQSALDGSFASAEKSDETVEIDFQRLDASRFKVCRSGDAKPTEPARINEAQFSSRRQLENRVRVFDNFSLRFANLKASCHAEMNDPLGLAICRLDSYVPHGLKGRWSCCRCFQLSFRTS